MRIAIVSPYPPRHCGIGAYALVQSTRLRAEGHTVTVISPPDGDGDVRIPFANGREFREAARRGASFDRIIIHFQPGLHYRPGATAALSKIRSSLGLHALVRSRQQTEILVHEAPRPKRWRPGSHDPASSLRPRATPLPHERRARGVRTGLSDAGSRPDVRSPRWGPRRRTSDRDAARRHLGLDPSEPLLVCAGFLHPWKAFDRAVRASRHRKVPAAS